MPKLDPKLLLPTLPQVEEVLQDPQLKKMEGDTPRQIIVDAARKAIDHARQKVLSEGCPPSREHILAETKTRIRRSLEPSLRRVINASGVIIHTNLGRSVLASEAVDAVYSVASAYSTLEYDTTTAERGSRHTHCEELICLLTQAEAALAVNNNAAAVMMILSEFASGREAIVSRGELVEIGGSFRIPDIMAFSQASMVEVGTTNKTKIDDYRTALSDKSSLLLKVHPSNYRMIGFTESVSISELRKLADENCDSNELLVYEDQGSGAFLHLDNFGDYAEPTVAESLKLGCDLVSFSGDKLLGGPQAGIIVGKKKYIDRLKSNPLARVLRLDKITLAALEATLRIYLDENRALSDIPSLRMLSEDKKDVEARAHTLHGILQKSLSRHTGRKCELSVIESVARAGGGALPMCDIPSYAVCLEFFEGNALECELFLAGEHEVPIVARVSKESLLLDAKSLLSKEEMEEIGRGLNVYFDTRKEERK